jgi:hypothetical protein
MNGFDRTLLPPADRVLFEDDVAIIMADDNVDDLNPCNGYVSILRSGL